MFSMRLVLCLSLILVSVVCAEAQAGGCFGGGQAVVVRQQFVPSFAVANHGCFGGSAFVSHGFGNAFVVRQPVFVRQRFIGGRLFTPGFFRQRVFARGFGF